MLVFLSDIHLTDGTSGETIHSGAFRGFVQDLKRMAKSAKARELEIVLLGDIFDLIRSEQWMETKVRPWDEKGPEQEKATKAILQGILKKNKASLDYLRDFFDLKINGKKIPVRFTYLIGNHDWLINRYPSCREIVWEALGITSDKPFAWETHWKDYKVFARHGDLYDRLNYDGKSRNASSLGDAIVIEVINQFPKEVERRLDSSREARTLVTELKEIDNVRPYWEVPTWIMGIVRRVHQPGLSNKIRDAWNKRVEEFFALPFVKKRDKWGPDMVDLLQEALPITRFEVSEARFRLIQRLFTFFALDAYPKKAYEEASIKVGRAHYVLYGHTHEHQIAPLDLGPNRLRKIYFNTGTWRKVHVRTLFDRPNREFLSWHVLTFVCFYRRDEAGGEQLFEVWNGVLGTQG